MFAGNGIIRFKASVRVSVDNSLHCSPFYGSRVPSAVCHVREFSAIANVRFCLHTIENRNDHGTCQRRIRRKRVLAGAIHNGLFIDVLDFLIEPIAFSDILKGKLFSAGADNSRENGRNVDLTFAQCSETIECVGKRGSDSRLIASCINGSKAVFYDLLRARQRVFSTGSAQRVLCGFLCGSQFFRCQFGVCFELLDQCVEPVDDFFNTRFILCCVNKTLRTDEHLFYLGADRLTIIFRVCHLINSGFRCIFCSLQLLGSFFTFCLGVSLRFELGNFGKRMIPRLLHFIARGSTADRCDACIDQLLKCVLLSFLVIVSVGELICQGLLTFVFECRQIFANLLDNNFIEPDCAFSLKCRIDGNAAVARIRNSKVACQCVPAVLRTGESLISCCNRIAVSIVGTDVEIDRRIRSVFCIGSDLCGYFQNIPVDCRNGIIRIIVVKDSFRSCIRICNTQRAQAAVRDCFVNDAEASGRAACAPTALYSPVVQTSFKAGVFRQRGNRCVFDHLHIVKPDFALTLEIQTEVESVCRLSRREFCENRHPFRIYAGNARAGKVTFPVSVTGGFPQVERSKGIGGVICASLDKGAEQVSFSALNRNNKIGIHVGRLCLLSVRDVQGRKTVACIGRRHFILGNNGGI